MKTPNLPVFIFCRFVPTALFLWTLFFASISGIAAQQSEDGTAGRPAAQTTGRAYQIRPVRTDSPRDTIATFQRLRADLEKALLSYLADTTRDNAEYIQVLMSQFRSLVDLSAIPHVLAPRGWP